MNKKYTNIKCAKWEYANGIESKIVFNCLSNKPKRKVHPTKQKGTIIALDSTCMYSNVNWGYGYVNMQLQNSWITW